MSDWRIAVQPFVLLIAAQLFAAGTPGTGLSRADSSAVHRRAQSAQRDFERARRTHLPWGDGSGGQCREIIGRFCLFGDDEVGGRLPEQPEAIGRYRAKLLDALERAAERLPGDSWIAGQRVRYLVESKRLAEAVAAARSCRAEGWYCDALAGFALHAEQEFVAADSAFARALVAMPEEERCRWSDMSRLLPDDAVGAYKKLGCAARSSVETRWWWLADPLLMIPGNDRRTEHFARQVAARFERETRPTSDASWGDDVYELRVRFGWPVAWWRARPSGLLVGPASPVVVSYTPVPAFRFLPTGRSPDDSALREAERWWVRPPVARERYAPPYAKAFVPLAEHQIARFRRGDSTLVVAAFDVRADTLFGNRRVEAALGLSLDESAPPVVVRHERASPMGTLVAVAPWTPAMMSVEVLLAEEKHVARARALAGPGLAWNGTVGLSDLLLVDPRGASATSLDQIVARGDAAPSERMRAGERLALYWEVYGLEAGVTVTSSLGVTRGRSGWLRRTGEALHLAARTTPVELHWQDVPEPHDGISGRTLALDLSTLAPGRWTIELAVRPAGREPLIARRELEIVR